MRRSSVLVAGLTLLGSFLATLTAASAADSITARPTDLPKSCTAVPHLAEVSPPPLFSNGSSIFDEVPSALNTQFPSVFGGVNVAPGKAGESPEEVNSHFIVLERVHDPALEAEATSAYRSPLTVTFELTPRTVTCLTDVNTSIRGSLNAISSARINLVGFGTGARQIDVDITECKGKSAQSAVEWFAKRWGAAVNVNTCQKVATTGPLIKSLVPKGKIKASNPRSS
jgi:hypothetical protein